MDRSRSDLDTIESTVLDFDMLRNLRYKINTSQGNLYKTIDFLLAISIDVVLTLYAFTLSLVGNPIESRVSELAEDLGAASFSERREIVAELLTFGPEKCGDALSPDLEALGIPAIARLLRSEDEATVAHAAWALAELGSSSPAAVEPLQEALRDQNEIKRVAAASALARLSSGDSDLLAAILVTALNGGSVGVLPDLPFLGEHAAPAVPAIARFLSHSEIGVARDAALSLMNLGPFAAAARDELLRATRHPDSSVRFYSLEALARCGCVPPFAVAELEVVQEDEDELVRASAAVAIWFARNSGNSALENLLEASKASDPGVRLAGIMGLQHLWSSNAAARSAVEDALQDADENVRLAAWEFWSCSPQ